MTYASEVVRYDARADQARADTEGARSIVDRLRNAARAEVLAEARREAPAFIRIALLALVQVPLWVAVLKGVI